MQKRFCTLNFLFHPGKQQPNPTIIFRGKGKRISSLEQKSWDPRVHVKFQEKAWCDRAFNKEWTNDVLLPAIKETAGPGEESVLFCDNLDAQIQPEFLDQLKSVDCFRNLFPTQSTEYVQPVDAGCGRQVKVEVGKEFEEWLEDDDNLRLWEHGKLKEYEKRILITKFVGAAWEKICSRPDFSTDIYFQKTGCLLTLDGSEDHLINIEGMPDYKPVFIAVNDDEDGFPKPSEEPSSDIEVEEDMQLQVVETNFQHTGQNFELISM